MSPCPVQMYNAPGLYRLQAVGDHIRAFDVQVASPEDVADEVRCPSFRPGFAAMGCHRPRCSH